MLDDLRKNALDYHRYPTPGKIEISATKPLTTQADLGLAYTPGVAAACEAIQANPEEARFLTGRANLVGVVTNGTAVLGLGAIGPLAAKPVMEGKVVLFKKFAGIDCFDIELNENNVDRLVDAIAALEPTFGGINLEDIKAPECFEVERRLRERLKIPVFHDDQHGTAIIVAAAILNGLAVVGKDIRNVRLVTSGAGAAALSCLDMLVALGMPREHIFVTDLAGVAYTGRKELMDPNKARYCQDTQARTLADIIPGADVFLGLSAGGVLKQDMVRAMANDPLILALANPEPEILPELVRAVRSDAIIATGRSDYPNQVNNVLCFPFIFRGALDVGAITINEPMKIAAVLAIADLSRAEQSDIVAEAYGSQPMAFGPEYLIPKPFDPRLIVKIASAVAQAAMDSGVATHPIQDMEAYRDRLNQFVYHSGLVMRPVFARAKASPRRIVFAEGEDERVLQAVQTVCDEHLAKPILIGRPEVIEMRIQRLGLRIKAGQEFEMVNVNSDPRYREYWQLYLQIMERHGVTPQLAKHEVYREPTLTSALMVKRGEADGMICGCIGRYAAHLHYVKNILGLKPEISCPAAMNMLLNPKGTFFVCDTYVNPDPSAEQMAEIVAMAAEEVQRFGIVPRVALLSHSSFGSSNSPSSLKMRKALELIQQRLPKLEIDGEMHADAAISDEIRQRVMPGSRLGGRANLLVMPTLDAANISYNLVRVIGDNVTVGPILLGINAAAHILTPTATVRRIINMTALTVVDAQHR
ncbi:MAG: NADP-dependent malic enzyme [Betaproteobacteria bacterium]|nr:NADP-dependent malic enzyme [Betaproteobacteria bacterium]